MKKINKMGGVKNIMSLLLATTLATTACTDDVNELRPQANKQLSVNVNVKPTSRAGMIAGNALPNGVKIGVSVTTPQGEAYDGIADYINVPFTAQQGDGVQEWNPGTPIMLSGSEGTLHAYYPYTPGVSYTAVPVDITAQEDWMVAEQPCTVNDANPSANITLKHVQTAVNVNVQRDQNYTGQGNVTELAITSEGLASSATLNTATGAFSSFDGTNTAISIIASPFQLTAEAPAKENPYMFIPAAEEIKNFTITATIDGSQYKHDVTMTEPFAEGKVYKLNVTVTNVGLKVESAVILQDWSIFDEFEDVTLQPDNGSASEYDNWFMLTYAVPDETKEVKIFTDGSGEGDVDMTKIKKMVIMEIPNSRAGQTIIKEVTPSRNYTFSQPGNHEVYLEFVTETEIPDYAFEGCEDLISARIPEGITYIGIGAFQYCTGLTEITIPSSVTAIEHGTFSSCWELKDVTIGENVKTIGNYAFYSCYALERITIPNSVTELKKYAFFGCEALQKVSIPNSVLTIGEGAFLECYMMTEVTIGTGVKEVGHEAFALCDELEKITSLAMNAPSLDGTTFNVKESGVLYIPQGAIGYDEWMKCDLGFLGEYQWMCLEQDNYVCEDDIYYSLDGKKLFAAEKTISGTVNIKEGVEVIKAGAFSKCNNLTGIIVPNSVQNIGDEAFYYCRKLANVTMGENVQTIGKNAFFGNRVLASITSHAMIAPTIDASTFTQVKGSGVLYIPQGATGYDTWMQTGNYYLGSYNWTTQTIQ